MLAKNNHNLFLLLLVFWLVFSGGCNKEEQPSSPAPPPTPSPKNIQPVVQNQQSSVPVAANIESSQDFANRKDPFKPYVVATPQPEKAAAPARAANLLPIQSFELSKFKVAGIIVGLKENRALVIDPSGKGYVVKQGMLIGDSDGRIEKITATTIEVVEKYKDDNGRMKIRSVKLTLPQKR